MTTQKEILAARQLRYRLTYPERYRQISKRSKQKHGKKYLAQMRERHAALKVGALTKYGPQERMQCSWIGCEVSDPDMLSIDHVNNDGYAERKNGVRLNGIYLYRRLMETEFSANYATLCMNHQFKKRAENSRVTNGD